MASRNQAEIDVAQQQKHGAIGVAEANREKEIAVANATKVRDIGKMEASREKAVRIADLQKEQQVAEHEDSMVVVAIEANMNDYLEQRATGKVVEGTKRYQDVETVWTFTMVDGQWKVLDFD